jgi:hypothetical protein
MSMSLLNALPRRPQDSTPAEGEQNFLEELATPLLALLMGAIVLIALF